LKHIIIIPGTCAHSSNWFDQIYEYERLGHRVDYLDLNTYKYKTFIECVSAMFDDLSSVLRVPNNEVEFLSSDEIVLIGHSMGAMILLKILLEKKFFSKRNPLIYDAIRCSKIIFVQVPLKKRRFVIGILSSLKLLAYPCFLFHRYLIFPWLIHCLLFCKILEKKVFSSIPVLREFVNFCLNVMLMHNSFWGNKIKEFAHSNLYYKNWDAFCLAGLNYPKNISEFDRAMMGYEKNSHDNLSYEFTKNYFFTYGDPDFFCGSKETIEFAEAIKANYIEFAFNNHLPHHLFWHQKRFNELVLNP
jgi:pimeloyl-ACP methyl ester carboxylesterase